MPGTALLLVDIQYDFLPGGSLAVTNGDQVIPIALNLLQNGKWDYVVASQDWHPLKHVSFASTHAKEPFTTIQVPNPYPEEGGETLAQRLWPDHCVQGTKGAELDESIENGLKAWFKKGKASIVHKGTNPLIDAYSAFATAPPSHPSSSALASTLQSFGVTTFVVVGLATDYCVRASALDAKKAGFDTVVIGEGVRAVGGPEATERVMKEWEEAGVKVATVQDLVVLGLM